jgi:hypothetical protein
MIDQEVNDTIVINKITNPSEYHPDRWVILKITNPDIVVYKVFAGWHGGFASSESWKLSSGIVKVIQNGTEYEIHNESGSVYFCNKQAEGITAYMSSLYANWSYQIPENVAIEIISMVEYDITVALNCEIKVSDNA